MLSLQGPLFFSFFARPEKKSPAAPQYKRRYKNRLRRRGGSWVCLFKKEKRRVGGRRVARNASTLVAVAEWFDTGYMRTSVSTPTCSPAAGARYERRPCSFAA
jgi:hypothetical protein